MSFPQDEEVMLGVLREVDRTTTPKNLEAYDTGEMVVIRGEGGFIGYCSFDEFQGLTGVDPMTLPKLPKEREDDK